METKGNSCKVTPNYYQVGCDNIALGGLIRCLFVAGLWPITRQTSSSIYQILTAYTSMQSSSSYLDEEVAADHASCGPSERMNLAAQVIIAEIKGLQLKDVCPLDANTFTNHN